MVGYIQKFCATYILSVEMCLYPLQHFSGMWKKRHKIKMFLNIICVKSENHKNCLEGCSSSLPGSVCGRVFTEQT